MDPYAHLRKNILDKYSNLTIKYNKIREKEYLNKEMYSINEEYFDAVRYILECYKYIRDEPERCYHPPDNRDPLLKSPCSKPRCRAHLLMVEIDGSRPRRQASPDRRLALLMEAA